MGIVAAAILATLPAKADLTFNLDQVYASGGFGLPAGTIFGTVNLAQGVDGNTVKVNVSLKSGYTFVGSGAGFAIGFDLKSHPAAAAVTIANVAFNTATSHYSIERNPANHLHAAGTGYWDYAVDYTSPGASGTPPSSLSFTVNLAGGLTPADFVKNPQGLFFVSDIFANGKTGDVAAGNIAVVPEPSTVIAGALLLLPFGASALRILRRKNQARHFSSAKLRQKSRPFGRLFHW